MEPFDPAINYGPNDAGISAITIILGIIGLIAIFWLFGKIYAQVAKVFEDNNKSIKNIVESFDPAINYGPNDAGISAITIILGILGLIAISWLFGKIYAQVAKVFENNNKND